MRKFVIGPLLALFYISANVTSAIAPSKPREITGFVPVTVDSIMIDRYLVPVETHGPRPKLKIEPEPIIKNLTPKPPISHTEGSQITGAASWYCRASWPSPCHYLYPDTAGFDAYAAAGPALRAAIGKGWRNNIVNVNGVQVKLVDWCQCHRGARDEKVIDLYWDVYKRTGGNVTISW